MGNPDSDIKLPRELELLTCSAGDYAASQERSLTAYELIKVDSNTNWNPTSNLVEIYDRLRQSAFEKKCEVVTDIRQVSLEPLGYEIRHYFIGTGLKLKDNPP